ncbi:hypothetical protein NE236_30115 [Actinoallomurus purpureus]|uniref:hypothetical protein n=1 Tax=Actinoallomurus purpureus TaxID=478114 RepID=UPI002093B693|nr:hypothetical protein [Actinoallomurus purpureus]MCO6009234.1 hypothetical protein [Actinoallomurus purpureus]
MHELSAAEFARDQTTRVRDDPAARLALMLRLYEEPNGKRSRHLPYRRAAKTFMDWQIRRGLLGSPEGGSPGSPWWRAVNERLLRDGWEARGLTTGRAGSATSPSVAATVTFIRRPSARNWYRAHNLSIVSAYLEHTDLAQAESRTERFFMNLVLVRVLYTHALVSFPRLALGRLAPLAPLLGDPRLGMTGVFLSLPRILPNRYPLGDNVETYVNNEHNFGRIIDRGVIAPRLSCLYSWSAELLEEPGLKGLLTAGVPTYAWSSHDAAPWQSPPSPLVHAVRRWLPPPRWHRDDAAAALCGCAQPGYGGR